MSATRNVVTVSPVSAPDLAAWRKVMPQILTLVGAVLTALATHNWTAVGQAALQSLPAILGTLGLGGLGGLGMLLGPLVDFLNRRDERARVALVAASVAGGSDPPCPPLQRGGECGTRFELQAPGVAISIAVDPQAVTDGSLRQTLETVRATLGIPAGRRLAAGAEGESA